MNINICLGHDKNVIICHHLIFPGEKCAAARQRLGNSCPSVPLMRKSNQQIYVYTHLIIYIQFSATNDKQVITAKITRRRLARERKRCFSSSSEDGSRKR